MNRTALHIAVSEGRRALAKLLIEEGASIDAQDKNGWTPLHNACSLQNLPMCDLLLVQDCSVTSVTSDNTTPLHYIVRRPVHDKMDYYIDIITNIIVRGADINLQNKINREAPLHQACFRSNGEAMRILLEHGADVNLKNSIGETVLHYAVASGKISLVKLVLDYGADVNLKSYNNETPIEQARKMDLTEVVIMLETASKKQKKKGSLS